MRRFDVDAVDGRRDRPPGIRVIAPADSVDGNREPIRGVARPKLFDNSVDRISQTY